MKLKIILCILVVYQTVLMLKWKSAAMKNLEIAKVSQRHTIEAEEACQKAQELCARVIVQCQNILKEKRAI